MHKMDITPLLPRPTTTTHAPHSTSVSSCSSQWAIWVPCYGSFISIYATFSCNGKI